MTFPLRKLEPVRNEPQRGVWNGEGFRRHWRWLKSLGAAAQRVAVKVVAPTKPVLKNLAAIPLTVAGLACIDVGVFTASPIAGWLVTGVSLMWLEHLIADDVS
jgi:hypothetical protein